MTIVISLVFMFGVALMAAGILSGCNNITLRYKSTLLGWGLIMLGGIIQGDLIIVLVSLLWTVGSGIGLLREL